MHKKYRNQTSINPADVQYIQFQTGYVVFTSNELYKVENITDTLNVELDEPAGFDTITVTGKNLDFYSASISFRRDLKGALYSNNLTVLTPTLSTPTKFMLKIPGSLRTIPGSGELNLNSLSSNTNTFTIYWAYPKPVIDSISPRLIEVASPALIAFADDKNGASLTSSSSEIFRPVAGVEEIITEPKLYPNAPNPFDNHTELSYRLPDDGRVKIEVIDRFGAIVATLVNEQKRVGSYIAEWNAQGLPSGTYYARMTVVNSKGKVTQKIQSMTLIR